MRLANERDGKDELVNDTTLSGVASAFGDGTKVKRKGMSEAVERARRRAERASARRPAERALTPASVWFESPAISFRSNGKETSNPRPKGRGWSGR